MMCTKHHSPSSFRSSKPTRLLPEERLRPTKLHASGRIYYIYPTKAPYLVFSCLCVRLFLVSYLHLYSLILWVFSAPTFLHILKAEQHDYLWRVLLFIYFLKVFFQILIVMNVAACSCSLLVVFFGFSYWFIVFDSIEFYLLKLLLVDLIVPFDTPANTKCFDRDKQRFCRLLFLQASHSNNPVKGRRK